MKKIIILLIFINISLFQLFSQENIMFVKDVKEGMKGYGYTIIQGTNISKFDVTVVSVLKKYRFGKDAILIRIEGEYFEHTGVASGMSGSPIYIEDKLAGALAFGWSFSKDPLIGVTPIEYMMDIYDMEQNDNVNIASLNKLSQTSTMNMSSATSLPIPMFFSGFSDIAFNYYSKFYESKGFFPASGGGSGDIKYSGEKFFHGDAAAIVLVDGDLSMAGVGTVTTTDDDKYLLFGHAMYGTGLLKAPVAKAYINSIIPSRSISFKLGGPTSYVGYTTYDDTYGVAGVYGQMPDNLMIPVQLKIENSLVNGVGEELNFRIVNNSEYFSSLLSMAVLSSITSRGGNEAGTFSISYEIYTDYFDKPYSVTSRVVSFKSADSYASLIKSILSPIEFMLFNKFQPINIKEIRIKLNHNPIDFAFIEEMSLIEESAYAGEKVHLKVGVRRYQQEDKEYYIMPLDIPSTVDEGLYTIYVGNEYTYEGVERAYMPSKYQIRKLDDLMSIYSKSYSESTLKTWMYSSADALIIEGVSFLHLPPSYYGMLRSESTTDKAALLTAIDSSLDLGFPVLGAKSLIIHVKGARK